MVHEHRVAFAAKLIMWERLRLSVRLLEDEGYVQTDGLEKTSTSLDKGTCKVGIEGPIFVFVLFPVLWKKGAGDG